MTEEFLHYIWQHHLFNQTVYTPEGREPIEIISPGIRNMDEGPDFYNTRIKIGDTLWVGNCEIHVVASDWYRHGHHINPLFDNVILHVVYKNDQPVINSKGVVIPSIELPVDNGLYQQYEKYRSIRTDVRCKDFIARVDPVYIAELLSKGIAERLIQRTQVIHQILEANHYDWEHCAMIWLGKAFGFKVNEAPFEMLMRSIPFSVLQRSAHNLQTLEALLLGQAGLLHENFHEDYPQLLYREYVFLRKKYNLTPMERYLWKKMRVRPANFPAVRIAQLAAFLHKNPAFFQKLLEIHTGDQIFSLFDVTASSYWDNHYQLDQLTKPYPKKLSRSAAFVLAINTLVPLLFAYGHEKDRDDYKGQAIRILEDIGPEQNSIIDKWRNFGILARNASESQALLQIYNKHCLLRRCLQCEVFNQMMTKKLYAF